MYKFLIKLATQISYTKTALCLVTGTESDTLPTPRHIEPKPNQEVLNYLV